MPPVGDGREVRGEKRGERGGVPFSPVSSGHADGQWRSLDELADTDAFRAWVEDEFPERASLLSMDRRKFMQVMGASVALAGLTGCRYLPQRRAVPQVVAVEDVVPGKPLFYATSVVLSGIGTGVLARSNDGRPTKLEGAPAHPGSLGATDANTQAAVLDLYDPERTRNVTRLGKISAWDAFLAELREALATERKRGGSGVRIVTGAATSPTMGAVMERFLGDLPQAKWVQWEPVHRDNVLAGMKQAFGRPLTPVYRFDRADVVFTLDADPVNQLPGHVRYARDIMSRRRVRRDGPGMSRLYAVESVPTNMGATADHRLPVRARDVMAVALELARHLGIGAAASSGNAADAASRWIAACADDLKQHRGRAVVVVGDHQPAALHALVATINDALGATGEAVYYAEPVYARGPAGSDASIADLVRDMRAGVVRALVMLGVNPVYDAPADLEFGDAVRGVALTVHGGLCPNETSSLCRWHVPEAHSLF
ncbi:MAG: molybdopterin oxidoreductase, partial [Armatimonadetes bacterium]|nr:molybdopterin oxidoreductase [Armatimonadota bacterium]